ncbi:complex I 24 kDa subunit family protein [Bradymonas sediminis]|uniref:NAD(P)H-dependent oxidoreductase subunit E n=1 Tax=Bradymonas sediminis TaxID=1548548 RepID=A0A2Z4FL18_9DELT|nr:NAD(P)H-dependent oxidoreductase subunit E [Bradymonas sediminis]AWV89643.1 NAD(P)H-dependent oxidoreductase subunit E [Bradymonas sediminis]TDP76617.1 NADH dehydrogenase subunit E [Bradymonas sediminis]
MALQFSEEAETKFQTLVSRYPNTHAALLPSLLLAQAEFGWISVEVMDYLAERLALNPAQVLATATFYTMYNKQPVGKAHLQVCTTFTCAVCGGFDLINRIEDRLNIRSGETTADGKYTLSEVECLAACGGAPMLMVTYSDGEIEYFEKLDDAKFDAMFAKLEARVSLLPQPAGMH